MPLWSVTPDTQAVTPIKQYLIVCSFPLLFLCCMQMLIPSSNEESCRLPELQYES